VVGMRAADVMSRPVWTVTEKDALEQAAALLSSQDITAAPVVGAAGDLVGIISEGDLLRARTVHDANGTHLVGREESTATIVADVMTRDVITVAWDADVSAVAAAMLDHNVHSVPIVDDVAELTGIVCRHDLLRAYVRTDDLIQLDAQHRLDQYAGGERTWTVTVHGGVAEISGLYVDDVERRVVDTLARTVPGVTRVRAST
jgi:CBS domain-containing protein